MKSLEELLKNFGCVGDAFNNNGEFTDSGIAAYNKMTCFLSDLSILTGISTESIIRELDQICNENY